MENYIKLKEEMYTFNDAYDAKMEELEKESSELYARLQAEFIDEDCINYILATNSLTKLQDIKIDKLERLNLAKKRGIANANK